MEEGGASSVLAIADYADIPLAETQKELTPFQRMVITLEAKRQQDEAQEENPQAAGGAGRTAQTSNPQIMNSRAQPGGGTKSGETTTYINEGAK